MIDSILSSSHKGGMTRTRPDSANDAIRAKLILRRDEIIAERSDLMRLRADVLARLRRADRELADCRAAARFFEVEVEFPEDEVSRIEEIERMRLEQERANRLRHAAPENGQRWRVQDGRVVHAGPLSALREITEAAPAVFSSAPKLEPKGDLPAPRPVAAPTLREVIVERLTNAKPGGLKAAEIREHYERTHGRVIHEKTVGMTLYRLFKDGAVRRQGHTWFLANPGEENPGAGTPGSN